uniref:NADH dehydrogenase subunit 6 n=1 Tax=Trichuris sp. 2 ARS-2017 TaxID=2040584 RepID=A0A8F5DPQ0_9BILA|nr:NADH dehydrogenase subunit 6 [Trichuris sp. 2 ARS-2017]
MTCMLMSLCLICSLLFLSFSHPLWLSLIVFLSSICISLTKFYALHGNDMFSYLFVMVYSGGLLLLLVYMSSLVPNNNLTLKPKTMIFIVVIMCVLYLFAKNEWLVFDCSYSLKTNNESLGMSYFMNHKELMNGLIIFLLFAFCLISYMMSLLKYPLRSL